MTYPASTIAYWVGQANDTSTGTHPPGWSNGQRWSETAGEWQTDRNSWNAQATDTSTGAHPPGWTNGQLWSETATEWMNDRNSVYNSRYTEGYNAGYAAADAAESPRAFSSYTFTGSIPTHNGNFFTVNITGSGAAGVLVNNGTYLTAVRPGYWMIGATCGGYNNVGVRIYTEGALRADGNSGNPNAPDYIAPIGTHWVGFINPNGQISFTGRTQQAAWTGNFTVTFVPVPGYQQ